MYPRPSTAHCATTSKPSRTCPRCSSSSTCTSSCAAWSTYIRLVSATVTLSHRICCSTPKRAYSSYATLDPQKFWSPENPMCLTFAPVTTELQNSYLAPPTTRRALVRTFVPTLTCVRLELLGTDLAHDCFRYLVKRLRDGRADARAALLPRQKCR